MQQQFYGSPTAKNRQVYKGLIRELPFTNLILRLTILHYDERLMFDKIKILEKTRVTTNTKRQKIGVVDSVFFVLLLCFTECIFQCLW